MGHFKIDKSSEGSEFVFRVEGSIDEDASFTEASLDGASRIVVDLQQVSAINSCGIREWVKWVRTAPVGIEMVFKNCPKVIVDQANMVSGFLPENSVVESFYVPYFCEESGAEKMVLFTKGKEFGDGQLNPPESVKCDESGQEMEMDVIEAKYFKFITK